MAEPRTRFTLEVYSETRDDRDLAEGARTALQELAGHLAPHIDEHVDRDPAEAETVPLILNLGPRQTSKGHERHPVVHLSP